MDSPQGSSRYHLFIRPSEDLAGDESPVASLLPKSRNQRHPAKTYTFTLKPTLGLRLLASLAATIGFIIFVVDALCQHRHRHYWRSDIERDYIAAAVFLGMIMVHNFLMVVHQLVTRSFRITIEFRNQGWSPTSKSRKRPQVRMMLDLGLAFCLALSLIVGNGVGRNNFNPGRIAAVVFAYIAVLFQAFVAIPALDTRTLTLKLEPKSDDEEDTLAGDIKLPISGDEIEEITHHGSPTMHGAVHPSEDQPRQSAEQLV